MSGLCKHGVTSGCLQCKLDLAELQRDQAIVSFTEAADTLYRFEQKLKELEVKLKEILNLFNSLRG